MINFVTLCGHSARRAPCRETRASRLALPLNPGTTAFAAVSTWARRDVQFEARLLLQVADYAEEIACLRIATRPKHANETFRWRASRGADLLETNRCLDVIAQDRLAGVDIAGEHGVDAFAQQRVGERRIARDPLL